MQGLRSARVSVAPNASDIRGRLVGVDKEPEDTGSVWKVRLSEAQDVSGLPNFAQSYLGETIEVYVAPGQDAPPKEQDMLAARVAFRGDERSSRFVLIDGPPR